MKTFIPLLTTAVLLLTGCEYEAPLTTDHSLSIDPAILGLWEPVAKEGKSPNADERMLILKYSDTEYLVHYPPTEDGIYYRAYPINIGDVSCVQLQVIGSGAGPFGKDEKKLFHVAAYTLKDGELEIAVLNDKRVSNTLNTSEELKAAFLAHKADVDLFMPPQKFRRIKE